MKNIIIIGIMAACILVAGCGKKAADDAELVQIKEYVATNRVVVGYAIADPSKSTNMIFTITEIWKGSKEGSAVGITNGTQIRYQYPSPSTADLPDAAIVILDAGSAESRSMTFVRQGKVLDMTVQEFKTKIGL
jgi:hypothetical protein